jgi:hypothetical protein
VREACVSPALRPRSPALLANESASSLAGNRIITGTGANLTVAQGGAAVLVYDDTSSRWRLAAGGSSPGGGVGTAADGDALVRSGAGIAGVGGTAGQIMRRNAGGTAWEASSDAVELPSGLAAGDLLYVDGSENLVRIPIGTEGQVLTVVAGLPAWAGGASFDPATLSLTGWWRGSYAGSPWTPTASAGGSGGNGNLAEATNPPATGAAVNGFTPADCDGTNDILTAANQLSTYVTAAAGSIVVLFRADVAAADGLVYDSPGLVGDNLGFLLGFTDAGVRPGIYDGSSWKELSVACSAAAWHAAQFKWSGGTMYCRVDSGAWSSVAAGSISSVAQPMLGGGQNVNGGDFFNGQIMEVLTASSALSDADMANVVSYFNARYGLSL